MMHHQSLSKYKILFCFSVGTRYYSVLVSIEITPISKGERF